MAALPDDSLAMVKWKEDQFRQIKEGELSRRLAQLSNVWLSTYFGNSVSDDDYYEMQNRINPEKFKDWSGLRSQEWFKRAQELAGAKRFFHWELEFPEAFQGESRGFDVVIGNPPYRKADEDIEWQALRYQIMAQNRFKTMHLKWDLYIPFIELAAQFVRAGGHFGMIVENSLEIAPYASKVRELLFTQNTLQQLHFFPGVQLFAEAGVYCTVFIATHATPSIPYSIHRYLHRNAEMTDTKLPTRQFENPHEVFRIDQRIGQKNMLIPLGSLCYINKGATLQAHDIKYRGEFVKNNLLSAKQDAIHSKPYIEGKHIFDIIPERVLYLEYGPGTRNPARVMEPRFPEMFENQKLIFGKTSGVILDQNNLWCDQSGRVAIPFCYLLDCDQRSVREQLQTARIEESKCYDLGYLLLLARSKPAVHFLTSRSTDTRDITPDTLKRLPIRRISFTTPADERARLGAELQDLYADGKHAEILAAVEGCLPKDEAGNFLAEQEHSDVVHDLLAFLAERMLEMNRQKQQEIRGFLGWLEGYLGAKVEDLTPKTKLQGYYEHDYESFLAVLKKNKRKLAVDPDRREPGEALKAEFEGSMKKLLPLREGIERTDELIDAVVYRLYALTEEEIGIVEGKGE
jgi:hypothetical protein